MDIIKAQVVSGSYVENCKFKLTEESVTIESNVCPCTIPFKYLIKINETTYINFHSDRNGIPPIVITCKKPKKIRKTFKKYICKNCGAYTYNEFFCSEKCEEIYLKDLDGYAKKSNKEQCECNDCCKKRGEIVYE